MDVTATSVRSRKCDKHAKREKRKKHKKLAHVDKGIDKVRKRDKYAKRKLEKRKKKARPDKASAALSECASGVAFEQGLRPTMEDEHVLLDGIQAASTVPHTAFYAVLDGHGGPRVSARAAKWLQLEIVTRWKELSSMPSPEATDAILFDSFQIVEDSISRLAVRGQWIDGSTCVAVLIVGDRLHCANLGDSRAVMCRAGAAVALSEDHKPDSPSELLRIRTTSTGIVTHFPGDCPRVNGDLALSRAFGDVRWKSTYASPPQVPAEFCLGNSMYCGFKPTGPAVSSLPDITQHHFNSDVEFVIVACDGIWDMLDNDDAVQFVRARISVHGAEATSQLLVRHALELGSTDNCTALIVVPRFGGPVCDPAL